MANFLSPLDLRYLDGHTWEVLDPFDYHVGSADSGLVIDVPKGFVTDFASTPRWSWWLVPPTGLYGKAAVVHDRLYQSGEFTRATADSIFLEALGVLGVPWYLRWLLYAGVRVGGHSAWQQHRRNA